MNYCRYYLTTNRLLPSTPDNSARKPDAGAVQSKQISNLAQWLPWQRANSLFVHIWLMCYSCLFPFWSRAMQDSLSPPFPISLKICPTNSCVKGQQTWTQMKDLYTFIHHPDLIQRLPWTHWNDIMVWCDWWRKSVVRSHEYEHCTCIFSLPARCSVFFLYYLP